MDDIKCLMFFNYTISLTCGWVTVICCCFFLFKDRVEITLEGEGPSDPFKATQNHLQQFSICFASYVTARLEPPQLYIPSCSTAGFIQNL